MIDDGETLETRSGAELFFKESDSKCDSPFRFKYQDAEMTLSEAWGHECRVKDVPKTVPYTIETFPFDREGGMWVKTIKLDYKYTVNAVVGDIISVGCFNVKNKEFLETFTWLDGTPCGTTE